MTDHQRAVDDLRSLCQSADQVLTDSVREAAADYRDACQAVNARLRRCEEFLQKGLRSEAIQFAEADPPLLEVLAALDFPERPKWEELAAMYGLPAAPKLRVETAEALNRAYSEEQPLQHLLRHHRRLNLAREPLRDRLTVLRQLHQVDGGNAVWSEDIRAFEAVRHRELSDAADRAIEADDFAAVGQCWDEVQSSPWISAPPNALVNRLRGVFLKQLADELHDALQGQHFTRAQRLREQWERLTPTAVLPADDPLWRRATPALRWLAREEEGRTQQMAFQSALANLEQSLRTGRSLEELRPLWASVRDFGLAAPPGIEQEYYRRVEELQKKYDRREKLILASVFSAGAVVLVGFFLVIRGCGH